jgi:PAS domain S-box-containing protein
VILLVPILLVQGYIAFDLFRTTRTTEIQANLELARAIGIGFSGFVQGILRQELSIAMTATTSPPLSPQALEKVLGRSTDHHGCVADFSWVSPQGRVLASSSPDLVGTELSNKDYFREFDSGREWVVSDLFLPYATGEPMFAIAHCIRDPEEDVLGVVVASVRAEGLQELLSVERARGAGVSLVDRRGMVVATYPAREFTWAQRNWLEIYPQKIEEAIRGKEIATTVTLGNGGKRLVGVAPIPALGWVAAASRAEKDAMGAVVSSLVTYGGMFLAVTLAAFGIALALYRPISASISMFRNQTLALGEGKIRRLAVPSGPSEVRDLAEAFNKMAEKVHRRVTELMVAEEALRESEANFRLLAENTADIIFQHDPEGRVLYASPSAVRALGYGLDELIGSRPEMITPTDDLAIARNAVRQAAKKGADRFRMQHRIRRKDGGLIWVETNGSLLYDSNGKVRQIQCLVRDMTERICMEESLRESEERFRILAEKSLVGVYLIQDDLFRYVNPAFAQVHGFKCEEMIDRVRPGENILPEDREAVMDAISRRISGEVNADQREFRIKRKDGEVREVEIYGTRVVYKGRPAILGTLIDITERKRMEQDLRLSRDELENRVRERTAELARRNRELEDFTFVAAHDLQEPLRKIQTFSDLVVNYSETMNGRTVDYIERMRETALRMQEVLRSLLTYSRLTTRAEPLSRIDLTQVALEAVTDLEIQVQGANAYVKVEKLPEVEADAGQMRQLFQNLLGNGLKFSREEEPPRMRIWAECDQHAVGRECRIFVEDNGIGFDEKYLDKIFQPFQRLHGRNEYPGTGIGLAICRKIVERHGGTITAKSTLGEGSTFMITLPVSGGKP